MKRSFAFTFVIVLLALSIIISLGLGRYEISIDTLLHLLLWKALHVGNIPEDVALLSNIIFEIRFPRIIAVVLVGSSLSVAGASFQAMFVNPLVSPGILGVLAGASFGAALGIMVADSWFMVQVLAFVFGFVAVLTAIGVAKIYGNNGAKTILLVLGGVISSALFSALLSVVKFTADPYNKLPTIVYWLMGSFSSADIKIVSMVFIPMLVGIVVLSLMGKYLNVLSLGDDDAKALGVKVVFIRTTAIILATLLSTLTVAIAGMIGWVGLIIPHIARFLVGPDNRVLIPMCALLGAVFLLIVDTLCRTMMTIEIPIGIATSLIGIPIFILALKRAKKGFA